MGGASIGRGSAHRVVGLSFDGGNDAVITSDGLDVMSNWQAYIGFSHYWTKSLNSTISTAWAELDNSTFQPNDAIHRAGSVHLNLIWFPYKLVSTGAQISMTCMVAPQTGHRSHSGGAGSLTLLLTP